MLISELLKEGIFGTSEEELAKAPPGDKAGDYYKKLIALKTNPQWVGKESLIQKRVEDLLNRLNSDKGLPINAQGAADPETDFSKFSAKNPSFKEVQSPFPSRNDPALAAQAAATKPGTQSVMPSRNVVKESAELDNIKELTSRILKG
jgi:hypothetical protein